MIDRDIDLNYMYGWNYNMLKFMGIWPEERKWNRPYSYFVLLPCIVMVCFICAPQTFNLSIIAGDSDLVIENLSTNITITISLMKTMAVWIKGKRKNFKNVFSKLKILPNVQFVNIILLFYSIIFCYLYTLYSKTFFYLILIVTQKDPSRLILLAIFLCCKH